MAAYAKRMGAAHQLARHDPFMDRHDVPARWFDKLRPAFDPAFAAWDQVLVVDVDVFPIDGLTANVFAEPCGDFGMVEEPDQPEFRERFPTSLFSRKADERWAAWTEKTWGGKVPRDAAGRPRTWNAGVILFNRSGLEKLRTVTPQPKDYRNAAKRAGLPEGYCTEQGYLNTLAFCGRLEFTPLPLSWNRQVHKLRDGSTYDRRDAETKFVHVMLPAADHQDAAWHRSIVHSHLGRSGR